LPFHAYTEKLTNEKERGYISKRRAEIEPEIQVLELPRKCAL